MTAPSFSDTLLYVTRTAHHEAGHAVSYVADGLYFRNVTIAPGNGYDGMLSTYGRTVDVCEASDILRGTLAGPLAEYHFLRELADDCDTADAVKARLVNPDDGDDILRFLRAACGGETDVRKALQIVDFVHQVGIAGCLPIWYKDTQRHAAVITSVADALMEWETRSAKEVRRIVHRCDPALLGNVRRHRYQSVCANAR